MISGFHMPITPALTHRQIELLGTANRLRKDEQALEVVHQRSRPTIPGALTWFDVAWGCLKGQMRVNNNLMS